jgi:heterodisulfide reductase subunit A-like polyferredoxin
MPYRITKSCIHPVRDNSFKQRFTETPKAFPISNGVQCERCAEECPLGAIDQDENGNFVILQNCDECGECVKFAL